MGHDVAARARSGQGPAGLPHRQHRPVRPPDRARGADLLRSGLRHAPRGARRTHRRRWPSGCASSRCSTGAARGCPPARSSGCRWPGRCCTIRRCWCWTNRPTAWTCWPAGSCASWCGPNATAARRSSSRTHYLAEAELLCDRVGLLHRGRLLREAPAGRSCARRPAPAAWKRRSWPWSNGWKAERPTAAAGPHVPVADMGGRLRFVLLTAGKELRETVRDRRTLAVMILFPLVVYPLLALVGSQVVAQRERGQRDAPVGGGGDGHGRAGRRGAGPTGQGQRSSSSGSRPAAPRDVDAGRLDAAGDRARAAGRASPARRSPSTPPATRAAGPRNGCPRRWRGMWPPGCAPRLDVRPRGPGARVAHGRLHPVQGAAADDPADGAAGGVLPGHRRHRRRARARHAGDRAGGAGAPARSAAGQGAGGDRPGQRLGLPEPGVDEPDPGAGGEPGRARGRSARPLDARGGHRTGDPAHRLPAGLPVRGGGLAGPRLQGGAELPGPGLLRVLRAGDAGGAGRDAADRRAWRWCRA